MEGCTKGKAGEWQPPLSACVEDVERFMTVAEGGDDEDCIRIRIRIGSSSSSRCSPKEWIQTIAFIQSISVSLLPSRLAVYLKKLQLLLKTYRLT
jgi:hypothetical protein